MGEKEICARNLHRVRKYCTRVPPQYRNAADFAKLRHPPRVGRNLPNRPRAPETSPKKQTEQEQLSLMAPRDGFNRFHRVSGSTLCAEDRSERSTTRDSPHWETKMNRLWKKTVLCLGWNVCGILPFEVLTTHQKKTMITPRRENATHDKKAQCQRHNNGL